MSDDEREEKELDLSSPDVVTKYKSAAEIVNKALQLAISECKPKVKIVDISEKADSYIREQTGNMYKNVKKIGRGVAFHTCVSVNNIVCHFSPLASDEAVLEEVDMVKIDMGCHIDGFIAVVAHTHVLQSGPVTGRAADVIAAANTAAEVALRLVRPGKKNKDVTEAIQKVAAAYDCKIVEGVLSYQLKQFVIDGNKVILSVSNSDTRVDDAEFEENEVYAVDIVTSTSDGKPKVLDEKHNTIYKRAVDKSYHLKMKASRFIFSEISQKFPIMPFSARALEEKSARLGLVECVNQELLQPNEPPPQTPLKPTIPPYMKALAGSFGGIMEASCLQPIDVIKTRLQLDRGGNYKGIIHCGTTIVRTEGVRALWKGLTPFATHLTLKYALRMGSNAVFQSAFKDSETGKVSNHGRLLSGFGAGVLEALAIVTPFEVVKIRLQQQRGLSTKLLKYKGPLHCARLIVREEGIFGLWAGAAPTVCRNGTNQAAMFTAKNAFDVLLWQKHEGDGTVLIPWQSMISGFLAGTAGPVCTGPFDVVKTRLMAQTREGGQLKYTGMIHAIRTIYAEEGLRALWKGLLPRLMRIPPGQAIMWGVADQIIGLYERRYINTAPL